MDVADAVLLPWEEWPGVGGWTEGQTATEAAAYPLSLTLVEGAPTLMTGLPPSVSYLEALFATPPSLPSFPTDSSEIADLQVDG